MLQARGGGIQVQHILSQPGEAWEGLAGYIDREAAQATLPPPGAGTRVCVCGPIPFNKDMQDMLTAMGYGREQVVIL